MSPVEPMEHVVIDLTIDDDEGRGGGQELLVREESEEEEEESLSEESSGAEESVSDEDDDGNDYHCDQLMNSARSSIVAYGKGCKNVGGSLDQVQGLYASQSSDR